MNEYDDIINLPHHQSTKHKHMSNYQRVAQFTPFAALTGYDTTIDETARQMRNWGFLMSRKAISTNRYSVL